MSAPSSVSAVRHNVAAKRYELGVAEELAVAEYTVTGDVVTFTHTWVPPALRGRGLAETLVRSALDDVRRAQLRVVPACSYVATFISRHREYADLLADTASR